MPQHWLGQKQLSTIGTGSFVQAQEALDEAAECGGIVGLLGGSGLGKSFALDYWLEDAPLATAKVVPFARTSARQFAADVLQALRQDREPPRGTEYTLTGKIVEELLSRPALIATDEAQWLTPAALKSARGFWLKVEPRAALAFAGGPEFEALLAADSMLQLRQIRVVRFKPLTEEELVEMLPGYHAIYEEAETKLLLRINRSAGNGNFRRWANFTRAASKECQRRQQKTIDDEVADYILERYQL